MRRIFDLEVRHMGFEGKVGIITGSGVGIGKHIARRLASEKVLTVISDIDLETAHKTAKELESTFQIKALSTKTDVKKKEDITRLVELTMKEFGRIDILVNNAGICSLSRIEDISQQEWDDVINVNLRGTFFCSQAVLPIMKKQRQGKILNIASLAGKMGGIAVGAHYAASKAGVICLTKSFAKALAPYTVTVNAIAPGPVDSPMTQGFPPEVREEFVRQCPLGRLADTADVAETALFLLSDGAKHITGEIVNVNGGLLMD
jgi:3-oxoacyl-[acyl-carrier protein] reductase